MAQLLGYLGERSHEIEYHENGIMVLLSMIHRAKFRDYVIPGDQCILKAELKSLDYNRLRGSASVYVDEKLMAEAELSYSVIQEDLLPPNKFTSRRDEYTHILTLDRRRAR